MINNVVFVSVVQQSDSVIHIHVCILFQILFPFRLLQNTEQSYRNEYQVRGPAVWPSAVQVGILAFGNDDFSLWGSDFLAWGPYVVAGQWGGLARV